MNYARPNLLVLRASHGGSGQTALCSHLALGLARSERQVGLLELGDQRMGLEYLRGLPAAASRHKAESARRGVSGAESRSVTSNLCYASAGVLDAATLTRAFRHLFERANAPAWIVIDAPRSMVADLELNLDLGSRVDLHVLRADPASVVSSLELQPPGPGARFVLNQIDHRRPLSRDIDRALGALIGPRIVARLHYDEALPESLARLSNVFDSAPASQIAVALTELVDFIVGCEADASPIVASRSAGSE